MRRTSVAARLMLVVLVPLSVNGQGLVSYGATAAAGSTAGAAAGAKLNRAIDNVLSKTAGAAERAAKETAPGGTVDPKAKRKAAEVIHVSEVPDSRTPVRRAAAQRTAKSPEVAEPASLEPAPPAVIAPPPIVATPEALAAVGSGAKREDLGKLGDPAYRMMIPEDGHLVEVYRYRADGKDVGSVRMVDGVVTAVQAAK